jgi:hypothetical protein
MTAIIAIFSLEMSRYSIEQFSGFLNNRFQAEISVGKVEID